MDEPSFVAEVVMKRGHGSYRLSLGLSIAALTWMGVFTSACSDDGEEPTASNGAGGAGGSGGAGAGAAEGGAGAGGDDLGGGGAGGGPAPLCPVEPAADPFTVGTVYGNVRGEADGDVLAFRGIPFAAPPVEDLRFRAPQRPECWEGVRDAVEYGSACVQNLPTGGAAGNEDCLYLNVWTPAKTGKRPVLFFVHGGALLLGSGSQDFAFEGSGNLYRGDTLAGEQDAVIVTINYRLAELGFMAHPALAAEDENGSSGNYGILDQIAALRWVQENIEQFGGDPERVMLFGESAGGLSTCLLMSSPLAKGLFSSALVESGGCLVASREGRFAQGEAIAESLACDTAEDIPACLRSKSADAYRVPPPEGMSTFVFDDVQRTWEMPFGPNLDEHVFVEPPLVAIREGRGSDVPLAIGSNGTEFELFIPPGTVNFCTDYYSAIYAIFGDLADEIIEHYSCFDYLLPRYAAIDVGTDFMFTCPARRIARAAMEGGSSPVFRYHYPHIYSNSPLTGFRSFHASELPFVFRTFDVIGYAPTADDVGLSQAIAGYWARFAGTGNPNTAGVFEWPEYDDSDVSLVLDDDLGTRQGIASERCDFWDSIASD